MSTNCLFVRHFVIKYSASIVPSDMTMFCVHAALFSTTNNRPNGLLLMPPSIKI